MKKIALVAALPFALTLAACGEQAADETTADEMAPAEAVDETVVVEELLGLFGSDAVVTVFFFTR